MKSPLNRGGLRLFLIVLAIAGASSTLRSILAGIPLLLLGTALHVWAKGCLHQNREVTTCGPYRFVRHPFYLANALIDGSIAVMSGWWLLEIALPIWWLAIYLPVMRREENYLLETFGPAYEDYRTRIGRLIPWRRPLPRTSQGFRWTNPNIAEGREIPRALRILATPALLLVCTNLRTEGLASLTSGWTLGALGILGALHASAWAISRNRRSRPMQQPEISQTAEPRSDLHPSRCST